jgi:1,2-diacylglycerol-3-alpha-glucose alpha-1,2-glucosyltransferase
VILEAASTGLPIVLRDIPAFDGWLSDGKDCLKGRNARDFARAIESIWKDDALRTTLRAGSEILAQAHDIINTAKRLYEVYSALMEGVR